MFTIRDKNGNATTERYLTPALVRFQIKFKPRKNTVISILETKQDPKNPELCIWSWDSFSMDGKFGEIIEKLSRVGEEKFLTKKFD